jgi:hypothetical protein
MRNYFVVESASLKGLSTKVNDRLNDGWEVSGSMVYKMGYNAVSQDRYLQPMIKEFICVYLTS